MDSRVGPLARPVHPAILGLPIFFYAAVVVFFTLYAAQRDPLWFHLGIISTIGGLGTALMAAAPAFLDWLRGIPTATPKQERNGWYRSLSLIATATFVLDLALVADDWATPPYDISLGLGLAFLGAVSAVAGSWPRISTARIPEVAVEPLPEISPAGTSEAAVADIADYRSRRAA